MLEYQRVQLGPLSCHVMAGRASPPKGAVLLCHGFGAPGDDLVPLAGELSRRAPDLAEQTLFVFPEAPLTLDAMGLPGGRAWWPLDMAQLQSAIEQGEFRDLRNDQPELLPAAREKLQGVIEAIGQSWSLPMKQIILGGFSQGAMLSTDLTLRLPEAPAALLIFSGTLLNEQEWKQLAPRRRGLWVEQSHGTADPILPFEAAEWLRDLLTDSGLHVQWTPFSGGHTIPSVMVDRLAERLSSLRSD